MRSSSSSIHAQHYISKYRQPHERNFVSGGKHIWGQKQHAFRSGRGIDRDHWGCMNPNCSFYGQNYLFDTISQAPGCTRNCDNCGDWIFNCRQTCPNPPLQRGQKIGQSSIISYHGTRISAFPEGHVNLSKNNQGWEQWTWISLGDNKYLWLSWHGTYLRGNENGTVDLAKKPAEWEVWTRQQSGGHYSWRSHHGTYLRGEPGGKINLTNNRRQWELWHS